MDESVSAAAPDAINKELAMDKCSEVVNALCICSAFKICAWPVVTALTLGPRACLHPGLHSCSSWGKAAPGPCKARGWAGVCHLCSPPIWIYHTEVTTGTKYMWLLVATSLPLTALALPLERFFFVNLIWCVLSVSPRPRLTGLESSSASPFMTVK